MRSLATRAIVGALIVLVGLTLTFALDSNRSLAMDSLLEEDGTTLGQSQNLFYAVRPAPNGALYLSANGEAWRELPATFEGEVRAVAANSPASEAVYVLTDRGLFATANGGNHWSPATAELDGEVTLLVPALPIEDMAYVVTDQGSLFKLADAGQSSMRVTAANLPASVNALVTNPADSQQLYAASEQGVWVSNTVGEQWERAQALPAATDIQFDRADPRILYVTTPADGLLRSADGGTTWQSMNMGLSATPDSAPAITALMQDPARPGLLYVATADRVTRTPGAVFMSEDGGAQWLQIAEIEAEEPIRALVPEPGPGVGVRAFTPEGARHYRLDADEALSQLESDNPEARLQGIRTLSIAAVPTQADAILPYIHDEDGQIGYYAARALGHIGGDAVTQEMVSLVEGDGDGIVKLRALMALQLIADATTLPTLERAFGDDALSRSAADALAAIGTEEAWQVLVGALDDPEASAQRQAAMAVFEAHSAEATEYLLPLLGHEDATVRANAAEALAWSGDASVRAPLRALLEDPDATVRARAAFALGLLGDSEAIARLTALSQDDPSAEVREAAAGAIGAVQGVTAPIASADAAPLVTPGPARGLDWTPWIQALILALTGALVLLVFVGVPKPSVPVAEAR
jgi:HEAT repeat protein/photosystem II stability/assembly factor-like uncharacterized protein